MSIKDSISRLSGYYSRNGFAATFRRASLAAKRAVFSNRMVVFYCDLRTQNLPIAVLPSQRKIEHIRSFAELKPQDLHDMTSFWNPELAHKNIKERFAKGAWLWLIKSEDNLSGYGWTLRGRTIEPFYFPMAPDDAHLFDFHIFPQYRGQGINPVLVAHILQTLAGSGVSRAFIEAAEWNGAQLASLRKTPFHQLGQVNSFAIFGRHFVHWTETENGELPQGTKQGGSNAPAMVKSHEQ